MANDKVFAQGIYFKIKDSDPVFVLGQLSFSVDRAIEFLLAHKNSSGYVNCDVKRNFEGKIYIELDTFQPNQQNGN